MWMGGQHHNLAAVLLGTNGTICIGGRVGPMPGLVGVKILDPPLRYGVQTVHPLTSRCTNCHTKD